MRVWTEKDTTMTKRLLIDAGQPEETRVVLLSGTRIEDFDYEAKNRRQLKGNVYLARVTRVEPSLQAAFVEYGGNRQGFLAFSEIHPDYYRIPIEDREALIEAENAEDESDPEAEITTETVGGDDLDEDDVHPRRPVRKYKIQEVISRKQIMLVQVVKEERGNKGAALTTYLSLAGRYCVLMPNSSRGGGVSRKITNLADRKRLKIVVGGLDVPAGMAVIVRTAGAKRTKAEISRDYTYLSKLWDDIRSRTLESQAPSVIHEEGNLIKRSIRDLYTSEVDEILVNGEDAYKTARSQMKMLIPSHVKKVQRYEGNQPIFQRYGAENEMETIHSPQVTLKSGGYLVINQTEALVAVDVNSGRSTRERNIEETALKTNLEAADELGRQLRLRDLSGLIVVDFIDMEENRNQNTVERRMKEAMRNDRARIQVGSISQFGLLEMSRQRLRLSFNESISNLCPHCEGTGRIRSIETAAMQMLRTIEEEAQKGKMDELHVTMHSNVALFILNHKRTSLAELEARYGLRIVLLSDNILIAPDYRAERVGWQGKKQHAANSNKRASAETNNEGDGEAIDAVASEDEHPSDHEQPKRRKRGRRGGRRRRRRGGDSDNNQNDVQASQADAEDQTHAVSTQDQPSDGEPDSKSVKTIRGGRGRGRKKVNSNTANAHTKGETAQPPETSKGGNDADAGTSANTASNAKPAKPKSQARKKARPKVAAVKVNPDSAKDAALSGNKEAPTQTRKKVPVAKTSAAKKAKKATVKKTARKRAAPKSAGALGVEKSAPNTSEKVASEKVAVETQRAPISSAPQDVIEVGEAKSEGRKRGWWNRS